jgi:ArsR family transcriptional regulator, arsenate/arsenite/antimonite-responsive transcriptional repressor
MKVKTISRDAAARKAAILKALAHPDRVAVFEILAGGDRTVTAIADFLGAKPANTSRHLALMKAAGLIEARKDGLNVHYSIRMPCLLSMLACMDEAVCVWADEQAEVARSLRRRRAEPENRKPFSTKETTQR